MTPHLPTSGSSTRKSADLKNDPLYKFIIGLAKWMDKWGIDPLVGFLLPAVGDLFTSLMTLPYLYFSLFRLKSPSLTLAILYNMLVDMLVGLIPYGIGDVFDIFHRSYIKNGHLVRGFVENDLSIIREVNKRARLTAILVVVLSLLVGLLAWVALTLISSGWEWLAHMFT